jgi:transposase-like protein
MRPGIFPFEPVFDLLSPEDKLRKCNGARLDGVITGIARRLDVDRQYVYRWLRRGLDDRQADTIAIALGLHPCLIWADWFARAPREEEVVVIEARPPRPVPKHRPPASVDRVVAQLLRQGSSWKEVATAMAAARYTNWRTGKPWRADQLCSIYGDSAVSA